MLISVRTGLAAAATALALSFSAPAANAQPAPTAVTTATTATTTRVVAATTALPCGFSFWNQSYRNCTWGNRYVVANAHESMSGRWVTYRYCFRPGQQKSPLAVWGMLVWTVSEFGPGSC